MVCGERSCHKEPHRECESPTSFRLEIEALTTVQVFKNYVKHKNWSSGGRVVKLLACRARGPGFDSRPHYLVLEF